MGRFSKEDKVNMVQVIKLIICFVFLCFVVVFTSPEYRVLMVSLKHCWLSITHPLATWFILYTTISFNKRKLDCSVQAYCPWILPFSGFHLISDWSSSNHTSQFITAKLCSIKKDFYQHKTLKGKQLCMTKCIDSRPVTFLPDRHVVWYVLCVFHVYHRTHILFILL